MSQNEHHYSYAPSFSLTFEVPPVMMLETHKVRAISTLSEGADMCHDTHTPCQSRGGGLSNPSHTHHIHEHFSRVTRSTEVITVNSISSREKVGVHIIFVLRSILGNHITLYHISFLKAIKK